MTPTPPHSDAPPVSVPLTDGLLPCPFCGGRAIMESQSLGDGWPTIIRGVCQCSAMGANDIDEAKAIAAWNRRPVPAPSAAPAEPAGGGDAYSAYEWADDNIVTSADERSREGNPHDMFEEFLAEAIAKSPEPLQELGRFLADHLDEGAWKTADRLLLQLATAALQAAPAEASLESLKRSRDVANYRAHQLVRTLLEVKDSIETYPLDDTATCMCGSPVEGHNVGSGHAPVSQADHAISLIVGDINKALGLAKTPDDALGAGRPDDYEGPDAGMHDTEVVDDDSDDLHEIEDAAK